MTLLLPVLLMILYPLAPALRLCETVRWFLQQILLALKCEGYVALLRKDRRELAALNGWLCDAEARLNIVIGYAAREQLGLPCLRLRPPGGTRIALSKPLSFEDVFCRFERLVLMLPDIERLAARRARRIKRELDANPLGLIDPRPAAPEPAAPLRLAGRSRIEIPYATIYYAPGQCIRAPPWNWKRRRRRPPPPPPSIDALIRIRRSGRTGHSQPAGPACENEIPCSSIRR
jgi:hypothetical protein